MQESKSTYPIIITLPNGKNVVKSMYATTKWHAIELAYTQFKSMQPERAYYKYGRNRIAASR